jgi:DNA polymerase-1
MIRALDSETTGVDFRHGAMPYFITTCDEDGEQRWWEWMVDPLTRKPQIPEEDVDELAELLSPNETGGLVMQNGKFDVSALGTIRQFGDYWRWEDTHDTLIAAHVLASNQPHDLTSLALHYLGIDIQPYEDRMEDAVKECRRIVQQERLKVKRGKPASELAKWRIAEEDLLDDAGNQMMPSAGAKTWKYDTWLPRCMAKYRKLPEDHKWWTVTTEYANADSATTVALWRVMEAELRRRGLWAIYQCRLKAMPIAYEMEQRGVTLNRMRLEELTTRYKAESAEAGAKCVAIAKGLDYDLKLPKSGNNNSLLNFCFGKPQEGSPKQQYLKLPVVEWTDTGNPSLNKVAMDKYELTLEGKQLDFVKAIQRKRKRDTSVAYMEAYRRFWIPIKEDWYHIHPSLSPTGTDTLRWSSSNPNSQNVSKQEAECSECEGEGCSACCGTGLETQSLRYAFGPAEGREWWALDYENIELRIPAWESGERLMIDLFEKPDEPPYYGSYHLMNASIIYPDLFWPLADTKGAFKKKYSTTWYQWCKNFGFSYEYGAGDETADRAAHKQGARKAVSDKLKELTRWNQHCIDFANKHGYIETPPDKTVDPHHGYPLMCTRTEWGKISPTIPLNYRTQGGAMWCTLKAMIRCREQLDKWRREDGFDGRMVLQVHDEIDFDFPAGGKRNLPKVRKLAKLMEESGVDIGVPLRVAINYHPSNWGEAEAC